jgi:hypothetical protein
MGKTKVDLDPIDNSEEANPNSNINPLQLGSSISQR